MSNKGTYDWRVEVLKGLNAKGINIPVTPHNLQLLGAWWHAEGGGGLASGKSTKYNWLNSSRQYPGSTTYNSHGVQNYVNPQQGVQATVDTLTNGLYGNILGALEQQAPLKNFAQAVYGSKWGTKTGIGGAIAEPSPDTQGVASIPPTQSQQETNPLDFRSHLIMQLLDRAANRQGRDSLTSRVLSSLQQRQTEPVQQQTTEAQTTRVDMNTQQVNTAKGIAELFYDPLGAYDEGNWISPIGGHSDHVHVSFNNAQAALAAIKRAQAMGLSARENPYTDPVDPVHTKTSYHYRNFPGMYGGRRLGMGLDVSGNADRMAAYFNWIKANQIR